MQYNSQESNSFFDEQLFNRFVIEAIRTDKFDMPQYYSTFKRGSESLALDDDDDEGNDLEKL